MSLRWTRELLDLADDCDIQPFKSSGPGGQKKNKTESSVRVVHRPTGIVRLGTASRSQSANKLHALDQVRLALEARARKPKPRVATKASRAAHAERLDEKVRRASVKAMRRRVTED